MALQKNATACSSAPQRPYTPRLGDGRKSKRHVLHDVIVDTLDLMAQTGGSEAMKQINRSIPMYDVVIHRG
jgi:Parkin co-regulated protein